MTCVALAPQQGTTVTPGMLPVFGVLGGVHLQCQPRPLLLFMLTCHSPSVEHPGCAMELEGILSQIWDSYTRQVPPGFGRTWGSSGVTEDHSPF